MMFYPFDTHKAVKRLKAAGMTEEVAETLVQILCERSQQQDRQRQEYQKQNFLKQDMSSGLALSPKDILAITVFDASWWSLLIFGVAIYFLIDQLFKYIAT